MVLVHEVHDDLLGEGSCGRCTQTLRNFCFGQTVFSRKVENQQRMWKCVLGKVLRAHTPHIYIYIYIHTLATCLASLACSPGPQP